MGIDTTYTRDYCLYCRKEHALKELDYDIEQGSLFWCNEVEDHFWTISIK